MMPFVYVKNNKTFSGFEDGCTDIQSQSSRTLKNPNSKHITQRYYKSSMWPQVTDDNISFTGNAKALFTMTPAATTQSQPHKHCSLPFTSWQRKLDRPWCRKTQQKCFCPRDTKTRSHLSKTELLASSSCSKDLQLIKKLWSERSHKSQLLSTQNTGYQSQVLASFHIQFSPKMKLILLCFSTEQTRACCGILV